MNQKRNMWKDTHQTIGNWLTPEGGIGSEKIEDPFVLGDSVE